MVKQTASAFWKKPVTRLGWWAFGLGAAYILLSIINTAVFMRMDIAGFISIPFGFLMILCGLASGVVALIAVVRMRERSILVWLPLLVGAFMLILIIGEIVVPH